MDQSTHDVQCTTWLNIIHQCQNRSSGMSIKQWLAENDIKEKAYYYWLRKFRKEAYDHMQLSAAAAKPEVVFAEITMPLLPTGSDTTVVNASDAPPAAVIRYNGLTIELSNDISEGLLSRLPREVYHA